MLRAILLLVALVIVLAIGAFAVGLIDLTRTQDAQAPKFEVKVNDVNLGTAPTNVTVPTIGTTTTQIETPRVTIDKGAEGNAQ